MHNNDSSEVSTNQPNYKSQKSIKMLKKIKCYLYKASWVFAFSYKLYLAQTLQICLGTPNPISPFPLSRYRIGYIMSSHV